MNALLAMLLMMQVQPDWLSAKTAEIDPKLFHINSTVAFEPGDLIFRGNSDHDLLRITKDGQFKVERGKVVLKEGVYTNNPYFNADAREFIETVKEIWPQFCKKEAKDE